MFRGRRFVSKYFQFTCWTLILDVGITSAIPSTIPSAIPSAILRSIVTIIASLHALAVSQCCAPCPQCHLADGDDGCLPAKWVKAVAAAPARQASSSQERHTKMSLRSVTARVSRHSCLSVTPRLSDRSLKRGNKSYRECLTTVNKWASFVCCIWFFLDVMHQLFERKRNVGERIVRKTGKGFFGITNSRIVMLMGRLGMWTSCLARRYGFHLAAEITNGIQRPSMNHC